jgi:hypothetical protein
LADLEKEKDDEFFRIINDNDLFKITISKIFEDDKDADNDIFENSDVAKAILHDAYSQCKHDEKYTRLRPHEYAPQPPCPQSSVTDGNSDRAT